MHCEFYPGSPFVAAVVTVFTFWNKTPHLHGQKSGSSDKKLQNVEHSVGKKTKKPKNIRRHSMLINNGYTACFWLVLTSPRFCTSLQNSKKCYCNYLIVGGEEAKN